MSNCKVILIWLFLIGTTTVFAQKPYAVICYHDIVRTGAELDGDAMTVTNLVNHFDWMKANGFKPMKLADLQAMQRNKIPFTGKEVLLTFDDGYASFYELVFPLLQVYQYPAMLALVGNFQLDADSVRYGMKYIPRDAFVNWKQVKEMQTSGWVEIASHTYNLHRELRSNKQGNKTPAATTFQYDSATQTYETEAEFALRVKEDMEQSKQQFLQYLGMQPNSIVWPYGDYNRLAVQLAKEAGFTNSVNLADFPNYDFEPEEIVNRFYITQEAPIWQLADYLQHKPKPTPQYRFVALQPNYYLDADSDSTEFALSNTMRWLDSVQPNMVILPLLMKTPSGQSAVYFQTNTMPVYQDRLNRTIIQMQRRVGVDAMLLVNYDNLLQQLTHTQRMQWFRDIGKVSRARGLIMQSDSLFKEFIQQQRRLRDDSISNPVIQRIDRQQFLRQFPTTLEAEAYAEIEEMQAFQSDIPIYFSISPNQYKTLVEQNLIPKLLNYFEAIIIRADQLSVEACRKWVKQLPVDVFFNKKLIVQLPETNTSAMRKMVKQLLAKGVYSYGTTVSDLKATSRLPLWSKEKPYLYK